MKKKRKWEIWNANARETIETTEEDSVEARRLALEEFLRLHPEEDRNSLLLKPVP